MKILILTLFYFSLSVGSSAFGSGIDCENSVAGPYDTKIIPQVLDLSVTVNTLAESLKPLTFLFHIVDSEGHPLPNISISPEIFGAVDLNQTHPDFINDSRFHGIATPLNELCSDSNGFVELKIALKIPHGLNNSENSLTLNTGSARSQEVKIMLRRE